MIPLLTALALLTQVHAAELAGVTLPDSVNASSGAPLQLNGLGLREHWLGIDIYVGGLYLPAKTQDAAQIIASDVPKRVVMSFIYRRVTRDQMMDTFKEGFEKIGKSQSLAAEIATLAGYIDRDMASGDKVVIEYLPGQGTTFTIGGTTRGPIAGAEFMKGIFSIFVGPTPASEQLKKGLLGG